MASAQAPGSVRSTSLRGWLQQARSEGAPLTLPQAVAIVVPLAVELAQRHAAGEHHYVHPSSVRVDPGGSGELDPRLSQALPSLPTDKACLAPEIRGGKPGNARSTVFAIGAMLYEICTGAQIGPGMRRPTEINPQLPAAFDMVLAKALVADPAHRPDDLKALAQAIHHLAPSGSMAPPPADESHLDHDGDFAVDVSMSMLPPVPSMGASPYDVIVRDATPQRGSIDQATGELAQLKTRLESDPRPRYVVAREGMDHGPFNAVELLQQIASHTFEEHDILNDTFSNDERPIFDWPEFAPFAEHAKRHRDIKAEKVALEQSVAQENVRTRGKAFIGALAVGGFLAVAAVWFLTQRGARRDDVDVQTESVTNVETSGGLSAGNAKGGKGRRVTGTQNGIPILAGGMSCEAAQSAYVEEIKMGQKVPADITQAQYGAVLNNGAYLNGCGVPSDMSVDICAAIQNGRAVGVTVRTTPNNGRIAACVAGRIRGINFPSHPKLDVTRTHF